MPPVYPSRWMKEMMESGQEENWPMFHPKFKGYADGLQYEYNIRESVKEPEKTNDFLTGFRERTYKSGIGPFALRQNYDKRERMDDNFTDSFKKSNGLQHSTRYIRTSTSYPSPLPKRERSDNNFIAGFKKSYGLEHSTGYTKASRTSSPLPKQERSEASFTPTEKSNGLQDSTQHTRTSTTYPSSLPNTSFPSNYNSSRVSEGTWKALEQKPQNEQKQFLERYLKGGKFRDEEATKGNVKRGDHLFYQGALGALYNHHLLCTDVFENSIEIVEYSGPSFGSSASSQSILSSNPLAFGKIQRSILTFEDLEEKKAKVRKWPKELERFPFDEVISRAENRAKNERDYHAFDNNCESFVVWCKCGLNTSLQVKQWYRTAWEGVKAGVGGVVEGAKNYGVKEAIPVVAKAVGNLSDEILGAISSPLSPVGFAIGGMVELGFAGWNIYKDHNRKKQGYLSERQFTVNTIGNCAKAACHIVGMINGSVIGSAFGPLGSIIGGGIGYAAGHAVGSGIEWMARKAPQIKKAFQDYVVAPVKKMAETCGNVVRTCANAVSTVVKKAWNGVKSFFSSLFSW